MEGSNRIIELQEKISEALINLAHKRSKVPEKCATILQKNLELQHQNAEKTIFLPKINSKKVACKYPLDKSVTTVFELDDEEPVEEIASSISQVREDQLNLLKVMAMMNGEKSDIADREL